MGGWVGGNGDGREVEEGLEGSGLKEGSGSRDL